MPGLRPASTSSSSDRKVRGRSDSAMKLQFDEAPLAYTSGSQTARVRTERWVRDWVYCPNCGGPNIRVFPNNSPLADFYCTSCNEEYELKSQRNRIRKEGSRRCIPHEVRTSGCEQQSKPLPFE